MPDRAERLEGGRTAEQVRLDQAREQGVPWKTWGPYLSERQWGTVREDYSEHGDAWNHFPHDHARSRAYRWGEDGLAGISDDRQRLCFALALWNGRDAILKERLFGLTNGESNHGEDVKEYYYYLESTPTHSYMKYLYKYPQAAFPYNDLIETSRRRSRQDLEYELLDTGAFDQDRYFDVFVEYAKASPERILIEITVHNRGPEAADLHVLPTLWWRNQWSRDDGSEDTARKPTLREAVAGRRIAALDPEEGEKALHCDGGPALLFTENETNRQRLFGVPNRTPYVKDGIDACVVRGQAEAVNPDKSGTKAAAHYRLTLAPGGSRTIRLRLDADNTAGEAAGDDVFGTAFTDLFDARRREAEAFHAFLTPPSFSADESLVFRQALAGMLWSKQYYEYDVGTWLKQHGANPFAAARRIGPRNSQWHHMHNADIVSMPDKWEYPWYAAWDLAFHVLALTLVDPDFGKQQLELMLRERYLHPNGQIPAYEWNFGDVNPPVHAWATIFTYRLLKPRNDEADRRWLEQTFHKLLLNFTWWVNRKDREGRNVFEGGFLGLDNIGVFDRSAPLPTGGCLEQADGTAWMALFSLNMLEIAAELTKTDPLHADMAVKFAEHFLWIASAMTRIGDDTGMWDEEDGFFYDVLRLPDGRAERLKVRSLVGLLPLCAVCVFDGEVLAKHPDIAARFQSFLADRPELVGAMHDPRQVGFDGRRLGAILNEGRLRRVLTRMLDEREFLSPYGIRSMSRHHADHPYVFVVGGQEFRVPYLPAESDSGMFGGNSNWRGPIWMPINALIVRGLLQYYAYFGNDFLIECPTGSGSMMNLYEVAQDISRRLESIFLRDEHGNRPVFGGARTFQQDQHWKDHILFYEYFHGDIGAGMGASHQTGWTGVVARLMHVFATTTADGFLGNAKEAYADRAVHEQRV
ncbi:glucosidase [Azospirillum brasilense]|uniref:Glucosidase n=1 Tax=Azospirillum brasilense TaxID=192 RepID=A0A0N7I8Y0_AZOBR|nr:MULTISPECIES: glucosidase [Azospirillum]ALJ38547.1 glucosidase [Azospirillum brasilense]MDW7553210.1 glucosidase [Azospirillum brasilense]MDW7593411.1 glucosidase [Azospirillum brasilense]MDW7628529.1 glucosidase [Azospirillum brasilense]MDX5955376.1 glucosidase [Azospirillum brasilense]